VADSSALAAELCRLLQDEAECRRRGMLARVEVLRNQGSTERLVAQLSSLLTRATSG
jgi:hypothetical protein